MDSRRPKQRRPIDSSISGQRPFARLQRSCPRYPSIDSRKGAKCQGSLIALAPSRLCENRFGYLTSSKPLPPRRCRAATSPPSSPSSAGEINIAAIPFCSAHSTPRSGPSTNSGVSQPSASMHVSAATVTDASACSTGRPVAGSMMCEYRRPLVLEKLARSRRPSRSRHPRAAPPSAISRFSRSRPLDRHAPRRAILARPAARTSPPSSTMKFLMPRSRSNSASRSIV